MKKNNVGLDLTVEALRGLEASLNERQLRRAIKSTLRKEARVMRKAAMDELAKADVHNAAKIAKTLRGGEKRRLNGLYVFAAYNGRKHPKGMYAASRKTKKRGTWSELKPIAFWIGTGTKSRSTRAGKNRGETSAHDYMKRAEKKEKPQSAQRIVEAYETSVKREIAKLIK